MQKMASKALKYEGWEILELSEKVYMDWTLEEKINNIQSWVREAKQRQIDKGVLPKEPKIYV